jgi:hypothetical protein
MQIEDYELKREDLELQAQKYCGHPGKDHGRVALDDLVIALGGKLIPGNFFFAASA